MNVAAFLAALCVADGMGWILAAGCANARKRFLAVGYFTLAAGCLFTLLAIGLETLWLTAEPIAVIAGLAMLMPGMVLRVFMWSENWRPARRVQARIARRRPHYDIVESVIVCIAFLISISSLGRWMFVGPSQYFWNIAGGISGARTFDIAAAAGIAGSDRLRPVLLWTVRVTLAVAIVVRFVTWG